jgi:hypothetical protein
MARFLLQQPLGLDIGPALLPPSQHAAGPIRPCAPEPRILPRVGPAGHALFDGNSVAWTAGVSANPCVPLAVPQPDAVCVVTIPLDDLPDNVHYSVS